MTIQGHQPSYQPVNRIVSMGFGSSFTFFAPGNPAPTYQWQISTNRGSSWSNLSIGGTLQRHDDLDAGDHECVDQFDLERLSMRLDEHFRSATSKIVSLMV